MDDYGRCLTLGRDKNLTRETYIAFIYESKLHIALHSHDKLALVDSINVGKSYGCDSCAPSTKKRPCGRPFLLLEFHYRGVSAPVEQEVLKLLCWYPVGESNP